jgi:hypothetical protein
LNSSLYLFAIFFSFTVLSLYFEFPCPQDQGRLTIAVRSMPSATKTVMVRRRFAAPDTRPSLDRLSAVLVHTQSMLC